MSALKSYSGSICGHLPKGIVSQSLGLKAGSVPYDRRRSQTIADRRRSQRDLFPYNRRRSQTIANDRRADCSHTFRSAEMSNVFAHCAHGKIKANNMADIEEEILLQANLFLLLVLKRRQVSFKTWGFEKIFIRRQDKLNFSPTFSQLLDFLRLSLKFLLL